MISSSKLLISPAMSNSGRDLIRASAHPLLDRTEHPLLARPPTHLHRVLPSQPAEGQGQGPRSRNRNASIWMKTEAVIGVARSTLAISLGIVLTGLRQRRRRKLRKKVLARWKPP